MTKKEFNSFCMSCKYDACKTEPVCLVCIERFTTNKKDKAPLHYVSKDQTRRIRS